MEENKKKLEVIDMFLEMISEDEGAPLDMKILNERRKIDKVFHEILFNENFIRMSDKAEEKRNYIFFYNKNYNS